MTSHQTRNIFTEDLINKAPISKMVYGYPYTPDMKSSLEWTSVSKDLRKITAKNNTNPWLDLVMRSGTGFINIMMKNLTLLDILELMCTSRRLSEIISHYIFYNDVSEITTRITDLETFFKSIPRAKSCNHSGNIYKAKRFRPYLDLLPLNIFEGRNMVSLDLSYRDLSGFNPENLRGVKNLRLSHCIGVTNDLFRCVQGIETLVMENVQYPNINGEAFAYFIGIKHLDLADTYLGCNGDSFIDTREVAFSFLQGIKYLNVKDIEVNDACLQYVAGAKSINISRCSEVTDVGIGYITAPGTLTELIMTNCYQTSITVASHEALKLIPTLNMDGCYNNTEICQICTRERRIDRIQEHLEKECDLQCTLCDQRVMIGRESFHLKTECTMNFFECSDCNRMILMKNRLRHENRCSERMITCDVCSDHVPYAKKNCAAHVDANYEAHEISMCQYIKNTTEKLAALQQMIDCLKKELGYDDIIYTQHQEDIVSLMRMNIHLKRGKYMKQLSIQCNMLRQIDQMRLKQERILLNMVKDREREEEYDRQQEDYDYWRQEDMRDRRRERY